MNLTPDTLYSIAINLDGQSLMKMCSANNEIRRICMSEKFNAIWTRKLLEEFNVTYDGHNSYMEYLQNSYLYKQTYWVATVFNKNDNYIVKSKILKNHLDAAIFLANEAMNYHRRNPHHQIQYFIYLSNIETLGSFEDDWNKYEITESEFEVKSQKTENYNEYIANLTDLFDLVTSKNEDSFETFRSNFQLIIAEEDGDKESFWERFREEELKGKGKNNKAIKNAFMKIFDTKNIYKGEEEEEEEEEDE